MTLLEAAANLAGMSEDDVRRAVSAYLSAIVVAAVGKSKNSRTKQKLNTLIGVFSIEEDRLVLESNGKIIRSWLQKDVTKIEVEKVMASLVHRLK